jgi:hypothetical protein
MAVMLLVCQPVHVWSADPNPAATSLDKVPADVEAYQSYLRLGEMVEIIGKSRAWKLLWEDKSVQELWKEAKKNFEDDGGEFKKFLDDPANKELPGLLADAFSQEVFVYLGKGGGDVLTLLGETANSARFANLLGKLQGERDDSLAQLRAMMRGLTEQRQRIRIPDMVFGFKVSDPAKVTAQLKRLDKILADALNDTALKGASSRTKVGEDEFLVLKLDASAIPWGLIPLGMIEEKEGEFAPLIEKLKKLKAVVSVGVREGYLLVALSESTDSLAKFGGKGPKLSAHPAFKPVAKFAERPLTSIGYSSAELNQLLAANADDVRTLTDLIKSGFDELELDKKQQEALKNDLEALGRSLEKTLEKPGAELGFSFRTPTGWESYEYQYSTSKPAEAKPLTLLNHLGGDPILAVVGRSTTTVEDYRSLIKWAKVFALHGEKVLLAKAPEYEEKVKSFHRDIVPILKKLNDTIEKLYIPALADGQEALVLDSKWKSTRWQAFLAESDQPLPMLELGIIVGVTDAVKLEDALSSFRTLGNQLIEKVREIAGAAAAIPEFEIPKPVVERKNGRTFAHYPIPGEWGLDEKFLPTGGLSKTVGAVTLSRGHTERLLTETPLKVQSSLLADTKKPLDSALYFNWSGLVDAVAPWMAYMKEQTGMDADSEKTVKNVMKFLKVFRSYSAITYHEEGATVTRSEGIIRDIELEKSK